MERKAIGYVRKSQVRKDADVPGLERQREHLRVWCEKNEIELVQVFEERKSAWGSKGRMRPSLKQAIEAVRTEGAQMLITWRTDRLTRGGLLGLGAILDPLHENGGFFKSTSEPMSSETPQERILLSVSVGIADAESDNTSKRVKEARLEEAQLGKAHGGVRPFGMTEQRNAWDNGESILIKQAGADILAGVTLRAIARKWNAMGLRGSRGGDWSGNAIGDLMRSPRLLGVRVHNGAQYDAEWPALFTPDEMAAIGAAIRGNPAARGNGTRSLSVLSGLLVCGRCGKSMHAGPAPKLARDCRYLCKIDRKDPGCGLSVSRPVSDEFVVNEVLRIMDELHATGAPQVEGYISTLDDDREALSQLVNDFYVKRRIKSQDAFDAAYTELEAQIAEGERQEKLNPTTVRLFGTDWWASADEQDRRRVLRDVVESVVVAPAGKAACRLNPADRLTINLRSQWLKKTITEQVPSSKAVFRRQIQERQVSG